MATVLTNESTRGLGLPGWRDLKPATLMPGTSVSVPAEYVAHLRAEVPGVAVFLEMKSGGIRVAGPKSAPVVAPAPVAAAAETLPAPAEDFESLGLGDDEPTEENTAPTPPKKPRRR